MKLMRNTLIVLVVLFASCKERYDIKTNVPNVSYLVVDGNLNNGAGPTTIRLSRTVANSDSTKRSNPELNATVTVEGKDNTIQLLTDNGDGYYGSTGLSMQIGNQYRLRIKTKQGKVYLSDYVIAKNNPPIDSVNWTRNKDGVTIFANTHDPQNNTWYYRWEYEETYEYHSWYFTDIKYVRATNQVVSRQPSEYVYKCYRTNLSSEILLGSSAKLQSDVISEFPLQFIPSNTEKLSVRYSILVRQYSLSKEAYAYLQIMKKNTESIGDIFGVLPAELNGNIHSLSDPSEQVIGYVTISPVQEKRIFIDNSDLPGWFYTQRCDLQRVPNQPDSLKYYLFSLDPVAPVYLGIKIVAYDSSDPICVDCTVKGGTTVKPSFW